MFSFKLSESLRRRINELSTKHPGIKTAINNLADNPHSRIKNNTCIGFGAFYVNAGSQYAVVFDLHEENNTISLLGIYRRPFLYKLNNGLIDPPDELIDEE